MIIMEFKILFAYKIKFNQEYILNYIPDLAHLNINEK